MTTFVVATNAVRTSETLCDYLEGRLEADDTVHAVNSLPGGEDTSTDEVLEGEEAIEAVEERLGDAASVDTHQLVRGNPAAEDVLSFSREVDADELVIGIRKRNPTGKVVFGSTAQDILLNADRPMAVVPLRTV